MNNSSPACFVLDSFALLAFLENEPGAVTVQAQLVAAARGEAMLCLPTINLGEIVYIIERERGLLVAQHALAQIRQLPIQLLEAEFARILAAAHIKAKTLISYADAFVVAAAQEMQAVILTGDPEFQKVCSVVQIEWLPKS